MTCKSLFFSLVTIVCLQGPLLAMNSSAPSQREVEADDYLRDLSQACEHDNISGMQALWPLVYDYNNDSTAKLVMLFARAVELQLWNITPALAQTLVSKAQAAPIADEYLVTALPAAIGSLQKNNSSESARALTILQPLLQGTWLYDSIVRHLAHQPSAPPQIYVEDTDELVEVPLQRSWTMWALDHWKSLTLGTAITTAATIGLVYYLRSTVQ